MSTIIDRAIRMWQPRILVTDRIRANELRDAAAGRCRVQFRIARWSESSEDIGGFRRLALDGGLSIDDSSRALLTYSVGAARVRANAGGDLLRLDKRGGTADRTRRDDVAAAAIFAAGTNARMPAPARLELVSV